MPTVKSGESRNDFVTRCVPIVMGEGTDKDSAVGKCEGIYNSHVGKSSPVKKQLFGKELKKSLNITINFCRKKIKDLEQQEVNKKFSAELVGIKKAMTKEQFAEIGKIYTACRKDGLEVVKSLETAYTSVMRIKKA